MIEKLYEINALDLSKVIINYQKELNISLEESVILIELCEQIKLGNTNLESVISTKLNIDSIRVSNSIARFIDLGYLELNFKVVNGIGKENYSIKPLLKQVEIVLSDTPIKQENPEDVIMYLETIINRTLSSKELEAVNDWLDNGKSMDDIKNTVKNLSVSGISITINRIERELFKLNKVTSNNVKKIDELIAKNKNGRISK